MEKLALPIKDGVLSSHFGHCEQFCLVSFDDAADQGYKTQWLEPPPHGPGVLPNWLQEHEVAVVVAAGMGKKAQELLAQQGIHVILGAAPLTAEELIAAYQQGKLASGENACDESCKG